MGKKSLEERVTEEVGFLCSAVNSERGLSHLEGWGNNRKRQYSDAEREIILELLSFACSALFLSKCSVSGLYALVTLLYLEATSALHSSPTVTLIALKQETNRK